MELRRLRYFLAVAEQGHLTRAAEHLHLAQPALTHQIKALEGELAVQLFRRAGRGIELTAAGEVFRQEALGVLTRLDQAVRLARETHEGAAGRLAIGLTDTASFAPPVTHLLKRARELWPKVEFQLNQGRAAELLEALVEARMDVGFIRSPIQDQALLDWRPFSSEGYVLVAPHEHPLATRASVEMGDLAGADLIMPRSRSDAGDGPGNLMSALGAVDPKVRIVQRTPEFVTAINLVVAGFGLAVVPEVLRGLRSAVSYVPLRAETTPVTELYVVSRHDARSRVVRNFHALADAMAPLGGRDVGRLSEAG